MALKFKGVGLELEAFEKRSVERRTHELAVRFSGFGPDILMLNVFVEELGSDVYAFKGINSENNQPLRIVQHGSQLNMLMLSVKRQPGRVPPILAS